MEEDKTRGEKFLPKKEFCCCSVEKFVAWLSEKRK